MLKKLRLLGFILAVIGIVLISVGIYFGYKEYQLLINTTADYYSLFNKNNEPIENLSLEKISKIEKETKSIRIYKKEQKKLIENIKELKSYATLKEEINNLYSNEKLNPDISMERINEIDKKYSELLPQYQKRIEPNLIELRKQKNYLNAIESEIAGLFTDETKTVLKEESTIEKVEEIRQKLSALNESEFRKNKNADLDTAQNLINKKNEDIKNAWVILNVPYISQNHNNVLNGCEAACLLMGLQYKGYLKEISLQQIATDIPKSENNAYEGFTHDIFGLEPTNVPHWIAPSALTAFGQSYSKNMNIIDATGYTLDQLDNEILNNNPVIIYATGYFKNPTEWAEGAPKNLHVLLLTGYNKITKEHLIIDPWTHKNGNNKWYISKKELEPIYNAVGKKAVIIR